MTRVAAFRFLARCLGPESLNSKLAGEISAGRVEWERVVEIASEYWMTLVLFRELDEKRLLPLLPGDLLEYFQVIHDANLARNQGILQHAGETIRRLNGIGVEPLLLKGAAYLATGLYTDPAVRFMDDIDLLVPGERALECWRLLTAAGYQPVESHRGHQVESMAEDWPPLFHAERRGEIEIHRVTEWTHLLHSPSLYLDPRPLDLGGGRAWILNPTSSLIFTLAHAYVHDMLGIRADAPLRGLYDATLLSRAFAGEIDWPRVTATFDHAGETESLRIAGMMWRRLFSGDTPGPIDEPRRGWMYWQRCLLKVNNRQWGEVGEMVVQNVRAMGSVFSASPEGKRVRGELSSPTAWRRKLRAAAWIYDHYRPPEKNGDAHGD